MRMKIFCCIVFLLTIGISAYNQEGTPFLTNFYTSEQSLNENYSITQNKEGVMVLANRKGILVFDADEWQLVKTPEVPYVVSAEPTTGIVYVGCNNDFGYLKKSETGGFEYVSLKNDKATASTYAQIAFNEKNVYYLSPVSVVCVNAETKKIQKIYMYLWLIHHINIIQNIQFKHGLQICGRFYGMHGILEMKLKLIKTLSAKIC